VHFTFLLHSITELALGPKQPVYSVIIDCDRKIRDFEVPVQWRISADDDSLPLDVAMYRWLVISAKETGAFLFRDSLNFRNESDRLFYLILVIL
jgi:hypothetical protein